MTHDCKLLTFTYHGWMEIILLTYLRTMFNVHTTDVVARSAMGPF